MGFQKGHKLNLGNQYAKGNRHTLEWKKTASERMKGNTQGFVIGKTSPRKGVKSNKPAWNKGIEMPEKCGENHPNWIKDRSLLKKSDKKHLCMYYKEWMLSVKERDNWKCKIDNGNCGGRLEAHHILNWMDYSELRYEINNGITLCHNHHPRKRQEENKLIPIFQEIIFDPTISHLN